LQLVPETRFQPDSIKNQMPERFFFAFLLLSNQNRSRWRGHVR